MTVRLLTIQTRALEIIATAVILTENQELGVTPPTLTRDGACVMCHLVLLHRLQVLHLHQLQVLHLNRLQVLLLPLQVLHLNRLQVLILQLEVLHLHRLQVLLHQLQVLHLNQLQVLLLPLQVLQIQQKRVKDRILTLADVMLSNRTTIAVIFPPLKTDTLA